MPRHRRTPFLLLPTALIVVAGLSPIPTVERLRMLRDGAAQTTGRRKTIGEFEFVETSTDAGASRRGPSRSRPAR